MLKRYQIISGEFSIVLKEYDCESAASEAIRLHIESDHHSCLGEITMVETKNEDAKFFSTQNLIDGCEYTSSFRANNI